MICRKVPFFGPPLETLPSPNMFLSAFVLPTFLCVTVELRAWCQAMALGEFSLIDQDVTDRYGPA